MISYQNALLILEKVATAHPLLSEEVALENALGRVLASSVVSAEEVPSFSNSAMDGFAVLSSDTQGAIDGNCVQIPVKGLIAAGDSPAYERACADKPGASVEIMTGAPIPIGRFDAVVRIEDVIIKRSADGTAESIMLNRPVKPGDNIRLKGTDYSVGQRVLKENTRVGPEHILACASLGITKLTVKRRPRVAILSTGSELVGPETVSLSPGMIRNSTSPYLLSALQTLGIDARFFGILTDDSTLYRKALERILAEGIEIVISTGAVSMGKFDFVPKVLKDLGATVHFHKSAIRPGKPILFAEMSRGKERCVFFGLPGNPVSTAVGLRFFVEPHLRALLGLSRECPVRATVAHDFPKPEGLRCFFTGRAKASATSMEVEVLRRQASYVVSTLLDANCWVVLPEEGTVMAAGTPVDLYPLHSDLEKGISG